MSAWDKLLILAWDPCSPVGLFLCVSHAKIFNVSQTKVEPDHTLKGSVSRRLSLFTHLAQHNENAARPPRRDDPVSDFSLQQDGAMV